MIRNENSLKCFKNLASKFCLQVSKEKYTVVFPENKIASLEVKTSAFCTGGFLFYFKIFKLVKLVKFKLVISND